jgi:hypothetical protein
MLIQQDNDNIINTDLVRKWKITGGGTRNGPDGEYSDPYHLQAEFTDGSFETIYVSLARDKCKELLDEIVSAINNFPTKREVFKIQSAFDIDDDI